MKKYTKTIDLDEVNEFFGVKYSSIESINWEKLVNEFIIPDWFIKKYLEVFLRTLKSKLIITQKLSMDLIKEIYYKYLYGEYDKKIYEVVNNYYFWNSIIYHQQLDKEFILELFKNNVIYLTDQLAMFQNNLPEIVIEKFIKSNNTYNLSKYQNLSKEFIINNLDKLDINGLKENISIPIDFKKEFLNFNPENYKTEILNNLNSDNFNSYFDYFDDYLIGYVSNSNLITRTDLTDNRKKKLFYVSRLTREELKFGKIISNKIGFSIFSKKGASLKSLIIKIPYITDNYCINEDLKGECYFKRIIPLCKTVRNKINYSI